MSLGRCDKAFNQIWVTENPSPSRGVSILRDKSVAIAMVLSMVLLLTLSLLVSTALVGTGRILAAALIPLPGVVVTQQTSRFLPASRRFCLRSCFDSFQRAPLMARCNARSVPDRIAVRCR